MFLCVCDSKYKKILFPENKKQKRKERMKGKNTQGIKFPEKYLKGNFLPLGINIYTL